MGWRFLGTIAAGMASVSLPGCGVGEFFTCEADAQCMSASPGMCQPDGFCSFPDAECPSGQRYGEHSGPHSWQCVGEGGTGSSGEAGSASGVGPTEPPSSSTGPELVTTGDEAGSEELGTGEPGDPDLVLWLALDRAPAGDVPDSSPYMGNGACEGLACPEGGEGAVGGGARFDGTDDFISVPHAPWLETTEAFTLAAFICVGDVPSDFHVVMAKPYGREYSNSWEIYFQYQLLYTGMSGADGEYWEVETPWTFPPDAWVHVAARWDGGLLTLWLDGEVVGSIEVPAVVFDEQAILVGADDDHYEPTPIGYFLGGIDDVRVYRRALTGAEIAVLAGG